MRLTITTVLGYSGFVLLVIATYRVWGLTEAIAAAGIGLLAAGFLEAIG